MRIRFPRLEYRVHIHPKPRGNWRPRVDFHLQLCAGPGECAWRPYLPDVLFLSDISRYREHFSRFTAVDGIDIYRAEDEFSMGPYIKAKGDLLCCNYSSTLDKGTVAVPVSDRFHSHPERGSDRGYVGLRIVFSTYISEGTEIRSSGSFYLPWRSGPEPDYSDYAKTFSILPRLLYELLQDGLDSGVSKEHRVAFSGHLSACGRETEEAERKDRGDGEEVIFV